MLLHIVPPWHDKQRFIERSALQGATSTAHIVIDDLGWEHLWVLYPGEQEYPLADAITALPLKRVRDIELRRTS